MTRIRSKLLACLRVLCPLRIMCVTAQDVIDINVTINVLTSCKYAIDGLEDESDYDDAIEVAILWLERITNE